ncbi:MAG: hypothetical protein JXA64_02435 [Candidatus Fermentibacteraceae bacterium]|nr:hypothetical protein [Candidatus Fermentibacteraceae bacterium]MBN2607945.1 hypothetical protein [Candidatus Fermentibacteraceae bacterium]
MSYTDDPVLIPLRCRNCGDDLDGLSGDVIFYCGNCGRCWLFGEGFSPVRIEFLRPGGPGTLFLPFWKVDVTVSVYQRISRRESSSSIVEGFREYSGRERGLSENEPETRRDRFIFPAFSTSLVLSTGVRMHRENFLPDKMEHGIPLKVVGGSVNLSDAKALARGVAVGVEVNRNDFLACVDLDIQVVSADVYAIGCMPEEHVFRINGSDIGLPLSAVRDSDEILRSVGPR